MLNNIFKDKKENKKFILCIIITLVIGIFINFSFINESDILVFISILFGFQITSISVLYNSRILHYLNDQNDNDYGSELIRLASYYKTSILLALLSVCLIIFIDPNLFNIKFNIKNWCININKYSFMPIIFISPVFWFYKSSTIFFKILIFPRNEN